MKINNLFIMTLLSLFLAPLFVCQAMNESQWKLESPDKSICVSVFLEKNAHSRDELVYKVDRICKDKSIQVIEKSPLGIIRNDQQFSDNLCFISRSALKVIDEKYGMVIGRQSECRNHANELTLTFKNEKQAHIQLVLRAYDDGVAFKYVFPEKSADLYTVTKELTGFKIPENGKTWMEVYDKPTQYSPAYEKYYDKEIPVGTTSRNVEGWAFPALFHSNGNWLLISEANLIPNYCGVRFEQTASNGLYKVRFPDKRDANGTGEVEPSSTLPWSMPWRTIIIGATPATILESNMINNLSDAAISGDFSWVKPGRSSWSWLSDIPSPKNYNTLKEFVDFSAEMEWEYSLVDANWDLMEGGNIEQLVKYAQTKGVGIFMWYNSGGPNNSVTERPRDIICDAQKRQAEFKKLKEWGVKGIKVDFWNSDKQNLIKLYHDVLNDAARFHIMVNFHGCTIPRGWSRTYPNLVSMESVRGEETYLLDSAYTSEAVIQNSILPFTRNVIGPMDYTPVGFSNFKYPHQTTYVHELALPLIFNSGVIHFADNKDMYRKMPDFVKDFLKIIPASFDETHYISGEPGIGVVLAARKGQDWYVAGINSLRTNKEVIFRLPYIISGEYRLNIIADGARDNEFANYSGIFKSGEEITIKMLPSGGFVARLSK